MTPGTMLLLTSAGLFLGLTAVFWGLAQFLQTALYSTVVGRLPLRAAACGLVVAVYLTGWVYLNTRAESKDRYGTLFEFTPTSVTEFHEFDAVRKLKDGAEKTVAVRRSGGKTGRLVEADGGRDFRLLTPDYKTVALEIKQGDAKERFDAELDAKGNFPAGRKVFKDKNRRYVEFGEGNEPSAIQAPSRGAFAAAIALNLLNFVVWLAAFWLGLRFTLGHALGLAVVAGGVTMLLLMPLLFSKNPVKPERAAGVAAIRPV